jgi:putative PIG3 family NAD(P)H quinone oxidoreductase
MKAVVFTGAGGNEVVQVQDRPDPQLAASEVLVGVEFAGMNPADVEQREGRYPAPPGAVHDVPGLEVSGSVVAVGTDVAMWKLGDRVFGLVGGGGLADRVAVHEGCVAAVPDTLDAQQAAAVPEAFITAHDALRQGGFAPGETVLVRGATGAVGSAAVQIARGMGATAYAPVRTEDAEASMRALGAIPLPSDGTRDALMEATDSRGVDVVIELVGGDGVVEDVEMLALRGRIVVVSVAAGATIEINLLRLMVRRATVKGTVLRSRPLEEKTAVVQAFDEQVVPMLTDGRIHPAIDSVIPAAEVGRAFDRLTERSKRGKVLLRFD